MPQGGWEMKVICNNAKNCPAACPHKNPHEPIFDGHLNENGVVPGWCNEVDRYCGFSPDDLFLCRCVEVSE